MTNSKHYKARRRARENKACKSKLTFFNEYKALKASMRLGLTWYRCPYCGLYHLTSCNKIK